ncbi:MAG: hypothetical protein JWR69_1233 [Pedosphaera sp.]|nr:hypothetical protein [Pedosphaera sp.]
MRERAVGVRQPTGATAFTLLELLVVLAIMGLLAAIGLPAIRGMSKSNAMAAADRQMLDDLAYARQRAIAEHTTVYMVFVPPTIVDTTLFSVADPVVGPAVARLYAGQYTSYALLSLRSVGDQPGRTSPRYLTAWRTLPQGIFIATNKFFDSPVIPTFGWTTSFPFPFNTNTALHPLLPHIGFDYLGRLVTNSPSGQDVLLGRDEYIPLAHGSIFYARDAKGVLINQPADVQEKPEGNTIYNVNQHAPYYPNNSYNQLHIDWLTGRARVEKLEIQ